MTEKPYHHGDLRNSLIEAGIDLINEKGIGQFSMRKIATMCGVSHTAAYAHFKDLDSFLKAMSDHVATQFAETLRQAVERHGNCTYITTILGKVYISFFVEHPNYYQFLFYHSGVKINLDDENDNNYQPFTLFRDTAYQTFNTLGLPSSAQKQLLIAMWALVHGIAALLTNENIQYSGDWKAFVDSNSLLKGMLE